MNGMRSREQLALERCVGLELDAHAGAAASACAPSPPRAASGGRLPAASWASGAGAAPAAPARRRAASAGAPRPPRPPKSDVSGSFDERPFGITTIIGTAFLSAIRLSRMASAAPGLRQCVLVAADPVQQIEHGILLRGRSSLAACRPWPASCRRSPTTCTRRARRDRWRPRAAARRTLLAHSGTIAAWPVPACPSSTPSDR